MLRIKHITQEVKYPERRRKLPERLVQKYGADELRAGIEALNKRRLQAAFERAAIDKKEARRMRTGKAGN